MYSEVWLKHLFWFSKSHHNFSFNIKRVNNIITRRYKILINESLFNIILTFLLFRVTIIKNRDYLKSFFEAKLFFIFFNQTPYRNLLTCVSRFHKIHNKIFLLFNLRVCNISNFLRYNWWYTRIINSDYHWQKIAIDLNGRWIGKIMVKGSISCR